MKTCHNCKHWRHLRDGDLDDWPGPHGECRLFDEYSQEQKAWVAGINVPHMGIISEDLSLITMPDFGCSEWVSK